MFLKAINTDNPEQTLTMEREKNCSIQYVCTKMVISTQLFLSDVKKLEYTGNPAIKLFITTINNETMHDIHKICVTTVKFWKGLKKIMIDLTES